MTETSATHLITPHSELVARPRRFGGVRLAQKGRERFAGSIPLPHD